MADTAAWIWLVVGAAAVVLILALGYLVGFMDGAAAMKRRHRSKR